MTVTEQVERLFSSKLTLYWRGKFGKLSRRWFPDTLQDRDLLRQFMQEAGISLGSGVTTDQLDAVGLAAGNHGYCIETIGDPDDN